MKERRAATRVDDRVLPHSIEAERALLGAILMDGRHLRHVPAALTPGSFFRAAHTHVYAAMLALDGRSQPIDYLTVAEELRRNGTFESVGGAAYLTALTDGMPRSSNATGYASVVVEHATRRAVIHLANKLSSHAYEAEDSGRELLDLAQREVTGVAVPSGDGRLRLASAIVPRMYEALERAASGHALTVGVATGYEDLDGMTGGLQRGDFCILAARPSVGKTSLMLNIARRVAQRGLTVGAFSLEMTEEQLMIRLICDLARVNSYQLRTGHIGQQHMTRISQALAEIVELPLAIDDTAGLHVLEVGRRCRQLRAERGALDLIVVDYLQLLTATGFENRNQEVSYISRTLKAVAKELEVPVLALSQLSRAPEDRRNKKPVLSDLRESGALEQDADLVMFIWRHEDGDKPAELIVAKQRNGPTGTIDLVFRPEYTSFESAASAAAAQEAEQHGQSQ